MTAGELAGEAGPVTDPRLNVYENPGRMLPAVNATAEAEEVTVHPALATGKLNDQPEGAENVIALIAYALEIGLVTCTVNTVAVDAWTMAGLCFSVGALAFPAANAGNANGSIMKSAEIRSNAIVMLEKTFLDCVFVSEFISVRNYKLPLHPF
jgi:hypothetical protein